MSFWFSDNVQPEAIRRPHQATERITNIHMPTTHHSAAAITQQQQQQQIPPNSNSHRRQQPQPELGLTRAAPPRSLRAGGDNVLRSQAATNKHLDAVADLRLHSQQQRESLFFDSMQQQNVIGESGLTLKQERDAAKQQQHDHVVAAGELLHQRREQLQQLYSNDRQYEIKRLASINLALMN